MLSLVEIAAAALAPMAGMAVPAELRSELLDAARAPVEAELGKKVRFRVHRLRRDGDWAFLWAQMQDLHGRPVDYAGTPRADAARQGFLSKDAAVLLRRRSGRWHPVTSVIGPTDVAWEGWATEYRAPASLFGD